MSYTMCPKCNGTGRIPKWPNPYTPLPANVIRSIKEDAPKCDKCKGSGQIEEA